MLRIAVPLLVCLTLAVIAAYVVSARTSGRHSRAELRRLSERAVDVALNHRELESDKELASAVLHRAVRVDATLPVDLLMLAEQHLENSPALAWSIADLARETRRALP